MFVVGERKGVGIRKPACPWNGCYWTHCQSVCFAVNRCNAINLPNALAVAKRATLCFDTGCRVSGSDRKQLNACHRIPQISSGFFFLFGVFFVVVAVFFSSPERDYWVCWQKLLIKLQFKVGLYIYIYTYICKACFIDYQMQLFGILCVKKRGGV